MGVKLTKEQKADVIKQYKSGDKQWAIQTVKDIASGWTSTNTVSTWTAWTTSSWWTTSSGVSTNTTSWLTNTYKIQS